MIIEGLVTTVNASGTVNLAPLGVVVASNEAVRPSSILLRPYPGSKTYSNLKDVPQGVFHCTDNVLLMAEALLDEARPDWTESETVAVPRLADAPSWWEFQIEQWDESSLPSRARAEVLHVGHTRAMVGLCRAKWAVIEAAILVSRIGILPDDQIHEGLARLPVIVDKTGSDSEKQALRRLMDHAEQRTGSAERSP